MYTQFKKTSFVAIANCANAVDCSIFSTDVIIFMIVASKNPKRCVSHKTDYIGRP